MERTTISIPGNFSWMQQKEIYMKKAVRIAKILFIYLIGVMLGRAVIFTNMNPMAMAYFSAVYIDKKNRLGIFIAVLLGLITVMPAMDVLKYLMMMILIVALNAIIEIKGKKLQLIHEGLIAALACLVVSLSAAMMSSDLSHLIAVALLEAVAILALVLIYGKGVSYLLEEDSENKVNNEVLISEAIIMGTAVAGIAGITVLGFGFIEVWIFSVVLILGYRHGIGTGAVIGVVSGIVLVLMGKYDVEIIGIFGMIGILSAMFRELGKVGSMVGFTLGTVGLWYFFSPLNLDFHIVKALIVSVGVFAILPSEKEQIYTMKKEMIAEDRHIDKVQNIIHEKLGHFSESFHTIAKTFEDISERRVTLTNEEVNKLLDDVAEKVCKNCSMCQMCWRKDFYDTYRTVFSIFSAIENKNRITREDIPRVFLDKCIKTDDFIETTNRMFEIYKMNMAWENRIAENRELISQQFHSVAHIIERLGDNLYANIEFNETLEEKITEELLKEEIIVKDVVVYKTHNGRMEVGMKLRYQGDKSKNMKDVTPIVSRHTGKKMRIEDGYKYISDTTFSDVRFIEQEVYRVAKGVSRVSKDYTDVSGDSYSFLGLPKGQDIIALSDGMGTGLRAFKESKAAIELMEQLLEAGFDGETAIKMVNSILVLKSSEQTLSTLDMSLIDRYTGICEFVKIGAVSSFVKSGNKVDVIRSTSLPMGMLGSIESESTNKQLKDGDMVVMVTDGILDCDQEAIAADEWVEEALKKCDSRNPQDVSDYILELAREKAGGQIGDDMTVIAMRIWEKVS